MEKSLSTEETKGFTLLDDAFQTEGAWNDPAVFNRLYQAFVHPIYRYIYSKVGDGKQAEDLTAEVFLSALESLPRYRHQGHLTAWLFSIARHKVADYYRLRRPEFSIEASNVEVETKGDPLAKIIQSEETRHISGLIHKMGEQDQEILRLRLVAELNFEEIGRLTHKSMEATKKRFYRLLAQMRQQLEHDHD